MIQIPGGPYKCGGDGSAVGGSRSRGEAGMPAAPYQRADTKIVNSTHSFTGDIKLPFKLKEETLIKGAENAARCLNASRENLSPVQRVPKISPPVLFPA